MAERNTQFFQIGFGHIGQDLEIDSILGKDGCVLGEADPIKPSHYLVIGVHGRVLFPLTKLYFAFFKSARLNSRLLTQSPRWREPSMSSATGARLPLRPSG